MKNVEKFEEVYGFKPNTEPCIIPENKCPARISEHPEKTCAECTDRNWWDDEYKG